MNEKTSDQWADESAWATLLTVPQVAARLGIGRTKVYELLDQSQIRSIRIGTARRVPLAAVTAYVRHSLGSADSASASAS